MLKAALEEDRAPALTVVAAELEVILLACHAGDDITDPAPRVEATVETLKLRLNGLETEEARARRGGGGHESRVMASALTKSIGNNEARGADLARRWATKNTRN